MKALFDINVHKSNKNGKKTAVLSIYMQDLIIRPPNKDRDQKQFNMALKINTPANHVSEALRQFADHIDEELGLAET